jgi:hypothetical protein
MCVEFVFLSFVKIKIKGVYVASTQNTKFFLLNKIPAQIVIGQEANHMNNLYETIRAIDAIELGAGKVVGFEKCV